MSWHHAGQRHRWERTAAGGHKGLAAIKPAGGQSSASDLTSNDMRSSMAKIGTDNMVRRPDSAENELANNLPSSFSKAATENMVRPPSK
jgi:hypothetical protein